ncbi:MAG: PilZ domain-containing protein [Candidatus Omnitrophica bacterium]|nr:PilZ domain-containing protein [Candidatus Omnitrophota bacterium]
MEERRKFNRWYVEEEKAVISCAGVREEGKVVDISAGGMKINLSRPVEIGSIIYGEFKILPTIGSFFVRGKVSRVMEKEGMWEVAVEFEKVSTLPLEA